MDALILKSHWFRSNMKYSSIPLQCRLTSTADVRHVETNYFWTSFDFSLNLIDEGTKVDQGRFPVNIFPILQYLFMRCLLDILLANIFAFV